MNPWTGTGHLNNDPKLLETTGGTGICTLRQPSAPASRVTTGTSTASTSTAKPACVDLLKAGREIAIDGRLLFDGFQTQDGGYASLVYIVAEPVEFLVTRNRPTGQATEVSAPEPAAVFLAALAPDEHVDELLELRYSSKRDRAAAWYGSVRPVGTPGDRSPSAPCVSGRTSFRQQGTGRQGVNRRGRLGPPPRPAAPRGVGRSRMRRPFDAGNADGLGVLEQIGA